MQLRNTCLAVLAGLILASCGGKDKKTTDEKKTDTPAVAAEKENVSVPGKLDGAWEIKRAEGMMAEENVGTIYEFKGNELAFGKGDYRNPGKTTVTDSTFSFQAKGNELVFMYKYKMNGDTLVVEMEKGNGQIFYMTKSAAAAK